MDLHDIWTVENSESKFWKFLPCNFKTKSMGANVWYNIFSCTIKKYTILAFTGKKNHVSKVILKNFGTICIAIAYVDCRQRCSLKGVNNFFIEKYELSAFQRRVERYSMRLSYSSTLIWILLSKSIIFENQKNEFVSILSRI